MFQALIALLLSALAISSNASAQNCSASSVAVQVVGSGGPAINRERASTSYLLWVGPQAKMLVDMGGGAFCVTDRRKQNWPICR
jgi:hypothetical protein